MARTNIIGIEMASGGGFANYTPGMMVIGDGTGRNVTLTEDGIDQLEALLEKRKAIQAALAVAPPLKWKRHPAADKVLRAETEHGVYHVEPHWDRRYDNRVQAYRVSFVTGAENIAKADSTDDYVFHLGDDVVTERLGREEYRHRLTYNRATRDWDWDTFTGEPLQNMGKGQAQRHAQKLYDAARAAV